MRWIALLLVLVPSSVAAAQDPRALIDEGVTLREQGRDEDALERFRRAYELSPSPEALAQIALAEQALGRMVDAEAHLREALAGEPDRFVRRYRRLLLEALGEIGAQLGTISIVGGVEGAVVAIGGVRRGTLPLEEPVRVVAGPLRVTVTREGYRPFEREIEVPATGAREVAVELEPLAGPAPLIDAPDAVVANGEAAWMLPTGIAAAGAGAAAVVVASVLMALREDHARARNACFAVDPGAPGCVSEFHQAVGFEAASVATYVAGGLLLAGGAILLGLELTRAPSDATACMPRGLGVACAF